MIKIEFEQMELDGVKSFYVCQLKISFIVDLFIVVFNPRRIELVSTDAGLLFQHQVAILWFKTRLTRGPDPQTP